MQTNLDSVAQAMSAETSAHANRFLEDNAKFQAKLEKAVLEDNANFQTKLTKAVLENNATFQANLTTAVTEAMDRNMDTLLRLVTQQ